MQPSGNFVVVVVVISKLQQENSIAHGIWVDVKILKSSSRAEEALQVAPSREREGVVGAQLAARR